MRQGDVVWVSLPEPHGSEPGSRRPVVVLQHDRFNRTRIATAIVVAVTSKLKYAELPGNIRLRKGEAGLPRASVVNVTQLATVDRTLLGPRLGTLTSARLAEIWSGVRLVCEQDATATTTKPRRVRAILKPPEPSDLRIAATMN